MNEMASSFEVCYATNDGYAKYCCISMTSLLENNKNMGVRFHILTDHLNYSSKLLLKEVCGKYGADILFYEMDDSRLRGQKINMVEVWLV